MRTLRMIGSIAGIVVGGAILSNAATESRAATQDETAVNRNVVAFDKFVVRPLEERGVIFQAAMHMDGNGEVTGELADVFAISLSESGNGVRAEHSETPLANEAFVDRGILANLSRETITVYLVTNEGQQEFVLLPKQSILIGEPTELLMASHVWGCVCFCCDDNGNCQSIPIACKDLLPGYSGSGECNCNIANAKNCSFYNSEGVLVRGTTSNCESYLVPASSP